MNKRALIRKSSVWLMIFRRKYADMILNGEKSVEIRWCGTKNIEKIKPGDYILIVSKVSEGIIGLAKVVDICAKSIKEMSDRDAIDAGFSNKHIMLNELAQIYLIGNLDEKYYLIKLVPMLDLRERPIPLRDLGINITYNDIKGKVIELSLDVIERILKLLRQKRHA